MQKKIKYLLIIISLIIVVKVLLYMFLTPKIYFNTFRFSDFNKAKNIISKIEGYKKSNGFYPKQLEDVGEVSGENGGKFYYSLRLYDKEQKKYLKSNNINVENNNMEYRFVIQFPIEFGPVKNYVYTSYSKEWNEIP